MIGIIRIPLLFLGCSLLSLLALGGISPAHAAKQATMAEKAAPKAEHAEPAISADAASESGLPLPRFASLRFDEVNVRTGPGTRYPIRWVYKRKNLPVEIIEEFEDWRLLKDIEGDEGWSHKSQLSGARNVVIREDVALKRFPSEEAPPMLKARKGVIARLLECEAEWCEVQVQSYKAWARKGVIWGVYANEHIE